MSRYLDMVDGPAHVKKLTLEQLLQLAEEIRALLVRQLASPVRWTATVQALTGKGARLLVECGPGKVLTALNRRIERRPDISCCAVEDGASLQTALSAAGSGSS